LMYDNEVGVTVDRKFRICKLDTDFFEDWNHKNNYHIIYHNLYWK
jgi:hypothetical protein